MPLVAPLALLGLLFIPVVIAMYMLKLRRDEQPVPSTLLWTKLLTDVEANAPWQKLRRSLLLLLQLLLVAILALLAARPFLERPAGLARDIILVIDTSASMAATDVLPNRLAAAKSAAIEALRELPTDGKVSVIAAERTARIVANETSDLGRVRQAIDSLEPTNTTGDLGDAMELASKLARRSGDAEILVATDGALASRPTAAVDAPVSVLPVGRDRDNQAIVALAVRTAPSGLTQSAFIGIVNLDLEFVQPRLEVYGDGVLLEAQNVPLDPQARQDIVIDDISQGGERQIGILEVRLTDPAAEDGADPDQLALDDRAWAVVPSIRTREILIVGEGDPYLETALQLLPNTRLFGTTPANYPRQSVRSDGTKWDLIIFEGNLPATLPDTPILAIAPDRSGPLGQVTGTLTNPGIGTLNPDEPILSYVDLSTTHIAEAVRLTLPDWARTVIPGPRGSPLLYAGERAGLPAAVLAFDPRQSDLPLQVAFPILLANLTGELMGASTTPLDAVAPGDPVELSLRPGVAALRVETPGGEVHELVPSVDGGTAVTFSATDLPGVYSVTPVFDEDASPAPSGAAPSPTPSPTATAAASPSPGGAGGPVDPSSPSRFVVALFDVRESTITPNDGRDLERLGGSGSGGPDASPTTGGGATQRPTTRDELWIPIVLLVLVALTIEWAVYHRDALARIRRALGTRLRRAPGGSA
ncbi:MAG TPA: VWA domain-containing protein [Clostridia bacterium]|nr:VWA domain-containing protein [Clostridia bacterium]